MRLPFVVSMTEICLLITWRIQRFSIAVFDADGFGADVNTNSSGIEHAKYFRSVSKPGGIYRDFLRSLCCIKKSCEGTCRLELMRGNFQILHRIQSSGLVQALGAAQIGVFEVSSAQVGLLKTSVLQVGAFEVGV